jgi:hypothetical protein
VAPRTLVQTSLTINPPLHPSTTHSLSPPISRFCPFSVINATPSCRFTRMARVPRHHLSRALSRTVLSRTLPHDQCLCWSTRVMRMPRHHRLHAHVCVRHSRSQSLAVVARRYSSHIRSPVFTRTQNCLAFHTSILAFACWFAHIDSRTSGMSSHSTRNITLPLFQEFFSQSRSQCMADVTVRVRLNMNPHCPFSLSSLG